MPDSRAIENDFLNKIKTILLENISDERFGVSELAHESGMSRSNLLRKIRKATDTSASQFIRQVRLEKAMELLKESSLTVSEISYQVGFSSVSYFIKCFHDHYGYPPGEVGKLDEASIQQTVSPNTQTHQLAAIMFTDIQGYTAIMQHNEERAIEIRKRHREIFGEATGKYNGKILQYYGDGTLSTFNSAIDAVRCGIALQRAFCEEPKIPVRIGIHSGDILFTDDGIVGDGVNIASRIESLANEQSVFISEKVYDEVKNQSDIQTSFMGKYRLKNVDRPVEVYAIANPGLFVPNKKSEEGRDDTKKPILKNLVIGALIVAFLAVAAFLISNNPFGQKTTDNIPDLSDKSIAVLPFINDSNDSTNVYFINGLRESVLNNLQKIKDLRVISRTSVEKYKNTFKTIPEIARELNVNYIIEGSGQKVNDQVLLHIQLIEAHSDKHLWAEQYNRQVKDVFQLQMDVAKNIAEEIHVIITPQEQEQINKIPTDNLLAYDYFLKGLEPFYQGTYQGLIESLPYFEKAVEEDPEFARAYAVMAIAYYYLDAGHAEKEYQEKMTHYTDQAMLFDPQLPQSLIAKALLYMYNGENELAVPYLEKALEYHPNSALVLNTLSDFYARFSPNTAKYLEYALKGAQLDIASNDSTTASNIYLHLSNALIQNGFVDEAVRYINQSLDYNPDNPFSGYVKAYILYAKNRNLEETKSLLEEELNKDTTRLDILQEAGKICYYMRDYESAYQYYETFISIKENQKLNVYRHENAKISWVLEKLGREEEAKAYMEDYNDFAKHDESIYKHIHLAMYYSYQGDKKKAIEHLRLFSKEDNYFYWAVLFLDQEPLADNIRDMPEFKEVIDKIKNKFDSRHEQLKERLEEERLI